MGRDDLILMDLPAMDSLICHLQHCRKEKNLAYARTLHLHICLHGVDASHALGNHLIPTFAACGSMPLAHQLFLGLESRNEFAWASLMQGYIDSGDCQQALLLYRQMHTDDAYPSRFTYPLLLKACSKMKSIANGQQIHMDVIKQGLEADPFVGNTMVDMYAKCGSLSRANEVFDGLLFRTVVTWNALITGYEEHGFSKEALRLFREMKEMDISLDDITSISILKACASLGCIDVGQQLHSEVVQEGYESDAFIGSILIDMYSKCGSLEEARQVFDDLTCKDVVVWTSMMAAYAKNGLIGDLKSCLEQMQSRGMSLSTVSFNAAIMGYAEQGEIDEALLLCSQMKEQGVLPDGVTFTCILKACSETEGIETGRSIHAQIQGMGPLESCEVVLLNALIDMYSKCGSMAEAQVVFDAEFSRDLVTWSVLIAGYAAQGDFDSVLDMLKRMNEGGFKPDGIVSLSLISVCSHAGLVNRGQAHFEDAYRKHDVGLNLAHYNCMLDLLVRARQLDEALAVMQTMPFEPDFVSWSLLVSYCQYSRGKVVGAQVFDHIASFATLHASTCTLLSNFPLESLI